MSWFNLYGLIFFLILMIPNIVYAATQKDGFVNKFNSPVLEGAEQISRWASFLLMIFNIPKTYGGFWFANAQNIYIAANVFLLVLYVAGWILLWKKNNLFKALWLSVVPSAMFIFSGIMISSIPLIISSVIFAVCHITISVRNV